MCCHVTSNSLQLPSHSMKVTRKIVTFLSHNFLFKYSTALLFFWCKRYCSCILHSALVFSLRPPHFSLLFLPPVIACPGPEGPVISKSITNTRVVNQYLCFLYVCCYYYYYYNLRNLRSIIDYDTSCRTISRIWTSSWEASMSLEDFYSILSATSKLL